MRCCFSQPVGKGQSLRIQRADEDDSDENSFSDDEDVPVPPPRRRALGPTVSLPAFRSNAVSGESKKNYLPVLHRASGVVCKRIQSDYFDQSRYALRFT